MVATAYVLMNVEPAKHRAVFGQLIEEGSHAQEDAHRAETGLRRNGLPRQLPLQFFLHARGRVQRRTRQSS